jgi:hypothetical protein
MQHLISGLISISISAEGSVPARYGPAWQTGEKADGAAQAGGEKHQPVGQWASTEVVPAGQAGLRRSGLWRSSRVKLFLVPSGWGHSAGGLGCAT